MYAIRSYYVIKNESEWERYRLLFTMHVNLKLIEQYRLLAVKFDKHDAYFFNYPFKQENLKSLQMAEKYYKDALYYWDKVLEQVSLLESNKYIYIDGLEPWEDELYRIKSGELDYNEFVNNDLESVITSYSIHYTKLYDRKRYFPAGY